VSNIPRLFINLVGCDMATLIIFRSGKEASGALRSPARGLDKLAAFTYYLGSRIVNTYQQEPSLDDSKISDFDMGCRLISF
jgi:hypothetical protein